MTVESVVEIRQAPKFNSLIHGVSDSIRRKSIVAKNEALNREEIQEAEGVARTAGDAITSAVMGFELIARYLWLAEEHDEAVYLGSVAELVSLLSQVVEGADRVSGDAAHALQHHYMLKAGEAT